MEKEPILPEAPKPPKQYSQSSTFDWVQCITSALIICILVFIFVLRTVSVVGSSMYPTLEENDRLIITNFFYTPKQGDIIVIHKTTYDKEAIIKRVIATEGQWVDIDFNTGIVYVDGEALKEEYVNAPTFTKEDFDGKQLVPEGCVFVMGDNRNKSTDSRSTLIGMVDEREILGKAILRVNPNFGGIYN